MSSAVPATPAAPDVHERVGYIGGSDAAALLGLSPWSTPFSVFAEKRGFAVSASRVDAALQEKFDFGHAMEPVIADAFARRTGLDVRRADTASAFLRNEREPFIAGHLDYVVAATRASPVFAFLECKNIEYRDSGLWGDPDEQDNATNVPPYYLAQCDHYFLVTGLKECFLAPLFGGCRLLSYRIERAEERLELLHELEVRFWARVQADDPPAFDGSVDDLTRALRTRYLAGVTAAEARKQRKTIQLDAGAADLLDRIGKLRRAIRNTRAEERAATDAFLLLLKGETGQLLVGDERWGSFLLQQRAYFDDFQLRMDHPDLCAKYESKRLIGPVLRLRNDEESGE